MILGIDLHGVIDADPEVFKEFMKTVSTRNFVYIISGPPTDQLKEELRHYGISQSVPHYARIFSVVDYLKSKKIPMWQDENGRWWASEKDWWSSKAGICKEWNVDIMIDDKELYAPYFSSIKTHFLLYKDKNITIIGEKNED